MSFRLNIALGLICLLPLLLSITALTAPTTHTIQSLTSPIQTQHDTFSINTIFTVDCPETPDVHDMIDPDYIEEDRTICRLNKIIWTTPTTTTGINLTHFDMSVMDSANLYVSSPYNKGIVFTKNEISLSFDSTVGEQLVAPKGTIFYINIVIAFEPSTDAVSIVPQDYQFDFTLGFVNYNQKKIPLKMNIYPQDDINFLDSLNLQLTSDEVAESVDFSTKISLSITNYAGNGKVIAQYIKYNDFSPKDQMKKKFLQVTPTINIFNFTLDTKKIPVDSINIITLTINGFNNLAPTHPTETPSCTLNNVPISTTSFHSDNVFPQGSEDPDTPLYTQTTFILTLPANFPKSDVFYQNAVLFLKCDSSLRVVPTFTLPASTQPSDDINMTAMLKLKDMIFTTLTVSFHTAAKTSALLSLTTPLYTTITYQTKNPSKQVVPETTFNIHVNHSWVDNNIIYCQFDIGHNQVNEYSDLDTIDFFINGLNSSISSQVLKDKLLVSIERRPLRNDPNATPSLDIDTNKLLDVMKPSSQRFSVLPTSTNVMALQTRLNVDQINKRSRQTGISVLFVVKVPSSVSPDTDQPGPYDPSVWFEAPNIQCGAVYNQQISVVQTPAPSKMSVTSSVVASTITPSPLNTMSHYSVGTFQRLPPIAQSLSFNVTEKNGDLHWRVILSQFNQPSLDMISISFPSESYHFARDYNCIMNGHKVKGATDSDRTSGDSFVLYFILEQLNLGYFDDGSIKFPTNSTVVITCPSSVIEASYSNYLYVAPVVPVQVLGYHNNAVIASTSTAIVPPATRSWIVSALVLGIIATFIVVTIVTIKLCNRIINRLHRHKVTIIQYNSLNAGSSSRVYEHDDTGYYNGYAASSNYNPPMRGSQAQHNNANYYASGNALTSSTGNNLSTSQGNAIHPAGPAQNIQNYNQQMNTHGSRFGSKQLPQSDFTIQLQP